MSIDFDLSNKKAIELGTKVDKKCSELLDLPINVVTSSLTESSVSGIVLGDLLERVAFLEKRMLDV